MFTNVRVFTIVYVLHKVKIQLIYLNVTQNVKMFANHFEKQRKLPEMLT